MKCNDERARAWCLIRILNKVGPKISLYLRLTTSSQVSEVEFPAAVHEGEAGFASDCRSSALSPTVQEYSGFYISSRSNLGSNTNFQLSRSSGMLTLGIGKIRRNLCSLTLPHLFL